MKIGVMCFAHWLSKQSTELDAPRDADFVGKGGLGEKWGRGPHMPTVYTDDDHCMATSYVGKLGQCYRKVRGKKSMVEVAILLV